jgi:ribosomal protein L35
MPKIKTQKAVAKRIYKTKAKKIMIRCGGQDHFNAKESGKVGINKRRNKQLSKSQSKNIHTLTPYM